MKAQNSINLASGLINTELLPQDANFLRLLAESHRSKDERDSRTDEQAPRRNVTPLRETHGQTLQGDHTMPATRSRRQLSPRSHPGCWAEREWPGRRRRLPRPWFPRPE